VTPYRISAREEKTRDAEPRTLATMLRLVAGTFGATGVALLLAMATFDAGNARDATFVSVWTDQVFAIVVPLLVLAIGARATAGSRLRTLAFATAGTWLVLLVARFSSFGLAESTVRAGGVGVLRVLAVAGLALVPAIAAPRRVLPRWPLFAAIALTAGDAADKLALARYPALLAQLDPSLTNIVLCALLAWTFFGGARALAGESIDDRAERLAPDARALFPDGRARAAFLGPVRLATDAALAFAVVAVGHARTFRVATATEGLECAALVVLVTGALLWCRRLSKDVSAAPIVAAFLATMTAVASTWTGDGRGFSIALLPFGLAILGVGVVAPRTTDPEARTMRRWVKLVSATGVMLSAAGFFELYSGWCGEREPFIAGIAKLGAVVFGIMAANASARIELHARIELAAEQQRT
jgi:hypothetical protein